MKRIVAYVARNDRLLLQRVTKSAIEHVVNPTPAEREAAQKHVRDNCVHFLNRDVAELWPKAVLQGEFRWGASLSRGCAPRTPV